MKKIITPFRVGLLAVASGALLVVFLTFARKGGISDRESVTVSASFKDASGLSKKSRVQIAGIAVGEIKDIALEGSRAKITLRIRNEVGAHADATLTKRSESLLGDYVLDLSPGTDSAPLLKDGDTIVRVVDSKGMEAIFSTLEKVATDVQQVTGALRSALGGEKGAASFQKIIDNLTNLSETVDETVRRSGENVDAILLNLKGVSSDIHGLTRGEDQNIRTIVENIRDITTDVRQVSGQVRQVMGDNQGDLKDSVASLKQTLARLDHTLENLETVTQRVRDGEGPVGKLLADERLGQKISETVEDVSDFASRLTRLQAEVSVKSEYLINQGSAKNTLGIRLLTRPDKYYLVELVDDPRGTVNTEYVQTNPPNDGSPATQVRRTTTNALRISAQFAKRFYFATVRFGLIESTGGLGADLHFFNDAVTFKADAFNFSVTELRYPRVRASLRVQAFQHLFATAGVDDMLNKPVRDTVLTNRLIAGRDFFVGGGIFFTDDDLKSIITVTGVPGR